MKVAGSRGELRVGETKAAVEGWKEASGIGVGCAALSSEDRLEVGAACTI